MTKVEAAPRWRACSWCGALYSFLRERPYGYCRPRCRTAAHRWLHANGGRANEAGRGWVKDADGVTLRERLAEVDAAAPQLTARRHGRRRRPQGAAKSGTVYP